MKAIDDQQDHEALMAGRVARFLFPTEVIEHDLIADQGFLKEVERKDVRDGGTTFVWFVAGQPGNGNMPLVSMRRVLVLRRACDDG